MTETLRNNPIDLRKLVYYEFLSGFHVFDCYKSFCHKLGNDAIDYPEFEFWFMRFHNGKFDFNYDRSLETKTRTFSDLPVEIIEKIGKNLNFIDRHAVRKVSTFFQNVVDGWKPYCKYISVEIATNWTVLWFDNYQILYQNDHTTSCMVACGQKNKYIENGWHLDLALNDLVTVLKNPKLRLEKLYIKLEATHFIDQGIEVKFYDIGRKVHTRSFECIARVSKGETIILSYLEAGTLEEIVFDTNFNQHVIVQNNYKKWIEDIGQLEQCKQSKTLTFKNHSVGPDLFPIEHFTDCSYLAIDFQDRYGHAFANVKANDVVRLKKILTSSTSKITHFYMKGMCDFTFSIVKKRFGKQAVNVPNRPNVLHFAIPKTNEYFELELIIDRRRIDLRMERKTNLS